MSATTSTSTTSSSLSSTTSTSASTITTTSTNTSTSAPATTTSATPPNNTSSSATNPPTSSSTSQNISNTSSSSSTNTQSTASSSTASTPSSTRLSATNTPPSIQTVTSTATQTPSNTAAIGPSTSVTSTGSKGFFANKGAVAGVFSVVGLIGLVFIIALITNAIRRRRAKKFDKEIAEAAAVPAPVFLDDDDRDPYNLRTPAHHYDYAATGGAGAGYDDDGADGRGFGQYSEVSSHGTYSQPPMNHSQQGHGETYGMRELGRGPSPGPTTPGVGDLYNPYPNTPTMGQYNPDTGLGAAAGAAGIGVARARSTRDQNGFGYANALQDGASPYAAFATPGYQNSISLSHTHSPPPRSPGSNQELLDAAGVVPGVGLGPQRRGSNDMLGNNTYPQQQQQQQQQGYADSSLVPGRAMSPPRSEGHNKMSPAAESYASHYQNPEANVNVNAGTGTGAGTGAGMGHGRAVESEEDLRGAYGGYKDDEEDEYDAGSSGEQGRRVLKVANE